MPKLVSQQSKQLFRHLLIKPFSSCTVKNSQIGDGEVLLT